MTITQFENARFGAGDKIIYEGITYDLASVEFKEALFGYLKNEDSEDIVRVRCENCEFIPFRKPRTMKKSENTPAFPSTYIPNEGVFEPGITIRDYFAAKAMQGLISKCGNPRGTEGLLTEDSYKIADALLTEREKTKNNENIDRFTED